MRDIILWGVLSVSLLLLLIIVFRKRLGLGWISSFGLHLVLASLGIYVINYSGLTGNMYIPINPTTIGTVTVLGLPGVGLLLGLKYSLFSS
ncbi:MULTISPECIES: pro-sigmaK processing inhibitor BofA family protein [Paenibacillus]|uniref:Pro-sigmaK processing inhibitor BofA family protein n=1 Tax=Paenibacillus polygoni TaxID=3050112 RepID=A0ABY8X1H5_9BACL|nr:MULTISPECIES: pro-sigmaK processing inhibitor BofA family protein [Paenibacillus]WIV19357.1 pro-sigmaK processing inhibitor BofA family protein [Paenibacillus polygoni]